MTDDDKVVRAAAKMESLGKKLTLWVTLPIIILLVVVFCFGG